MLPSDFGDECVHLIQNFFHKILELINARRNAEAESLLGVLREPNETHLGLSKGSKSRGRALGEGSAHEVWSALSESEAAQSGLLEDLEDTVLMIEGISIDIISDITTNIIREPLVRYTQRMCEYYGIRLQPEVDSGPLWSSKDERWYQKFVSLPIADGEKLLLVPKVIVRNHLLYDSGEYFRYFVLTHLQKVELLRWCNARNCGLSFAIFFYDRFFGDTLSLVLFSFLYRLIRKFYQNTGIKRTLKNIFR